MTELKKSKQKRVRFPYISIKDAIKFIGVLRDYKQFAEVEAVTALKKIGYTPSSSSADRVLSTMVKSYGLLDMRGTKDNGYVWLTRLAKEILLNPEGSEARKNAISQAVLSEELMQQVINKWHKGLPSRPDIIQRLILDFEFTTDAAVRFATVLQETFEVLDLSEYNGTNVQDDTEKTGDDMSNPILETSNKTPVQAYNDYVMTYDGGRQKIILRAPVDMPEAEYKRMIQWLDVLKDGMVKKDEKQEKTE